METPDDEQEVFVKKGRKVGSRIDVWEDRAERTSGGLRKHDLVVNEHTGKICTVKEIERGKRMSVAMKGGAE
jgi:hypothetical protein